MQQMLLTDGSPSPNARAIMPSVSTSVVDVEDYAAKIKDLQQQFEVQAAKVCCVAYRRRRLYAHLGSLGAKALNRGKVEAGQRKGTKP